ncbi:uncharacterized protein LOC122653605 isoform X3 [Telopea speciosissima]|uniref:uncharacterized protein LOC122653605 isoform X3 n=1 Tax=Telopea speciosissima TaxID=54955 RepID=UPI001CC4E5CC|nr:uncharacterized protein LOC122653605 isoform X3 [Telopea speciosissima]
MILNLTRMLRRKSRRDGTDDKYSLPTRDDPALDDYHPIDTEEQEELVRSFERNHAQQSVLWRVKCVRCLSLLFHGVSRFLHLSAGVISLGIDCVAVLACIMAITGLLNNSKSHRQWIWYSCYTGVLLAIFWLHYMLRMPKFRWDVLWLPFGPLSSAGICLYVDSLFAESLEDVRNLRRYMYAYKAS